MTKEEFTDYLQECMLEYPSDITVSRISSFEEAALLTNDKGLVIKMDDDSEFQVTIVRSK